MNEKIERLRRELKEAELADIEERNQRALEEHRKQIEQKRIEKEAQEVENKHLYKRWVGATITNIFRDNCEELVIVTDKGTLDLSAIGDDMTYLQLDET